LQTAVAAHFLTFLAVKTVKRIRDSTSLSDKEVKPSFRLTGLTGGGGIAFLSLYQPHV
jgi:hypothetical protein